MARYVLEESPFDRPLAKPLPGALETINRYVEMGHTVVLSGPGEGGTNTGRQGMA